MTLVRRLSEVALGGLSALAVLSSPANADGYLKPSLRVMPASSVIDVRALTFKPLILGSDLALRSGPRFPRAAVDMTKGFELRIFRIDGPGDTPTAWKKGQDGCDVFLSLVFKHLKFRGDKVEIGGMQGQFWLNRSPDGVLTPGYFLFVIEQDSAPDPQSERGSWEVFRLATLLRKNYFDQGVEVEIDQRYGPFGITMRGPDTDGQMKAALDLVASTISSRFNCYQARPIEVTANAPREVVLEACGLGAQLGPTENR